VHYRTAAVGGISIFHREAGPDSAPAVLLLHGFPSASRMLRNLIPALGRPPRHRLGPPPFGHSAVPDRFGVGYTFDNLADVVHSLPGQLGNR